MRDDELRARLTQAVDHQLSAMEGDPYLARRIIQAEKGDQPVMKKKLSVSLVLTLVLMLLTLSVAAALVQSNIVGMLYPSPESAPQAVLEQLHTPQETTAASSGILTLNEWLFDGSSLHTSFTIENPTAEPLLYTLDGVWLNDKPLFHNKSNISGAGDDGRILGGTVDGAALPASASIYHESTGVYLFDDNGKFQGYGPLPQGEATLKVTMAVWKPIHDVKLVDYDQYEGEDTAETRDHLTVSKDGQSALWMFRPEAAFRSCNASQSGAQIYKDVYKELGWAELTDMITVETAVTLNLDDVQHVVPTAATYEQQDFTLTISRFDMSHAGGVMEGMITGNGDTVKTMLQSGLGLCLADREGQRILSGACTWTEQPEGTSFTLKLQPLTGELPTQAVLAPVVRLEERWDATLPCYDPTLEKPAAAIGHYELDFGHAITIDLEIGK